MKENDKKSLAAGVWYTASRFIVKGLAFITTPLFTRLMTKTEYGNYSDIQFWLTMMTYITGFELYYSVMIAKHDYREDIDSFSSSIYVLSSFFTVGVFLLGILFSKQLIALFDIRTPLLFPLLFFYLLGESAFMIMQTKHRAFYKYKLFVAFSLGTSIAATGLSLLFVFRMPTNRVDARLIGTMLPIAVLGTILGIITLIRGKRIKKEYWKYALHISAPLVINAVSITLLSSVNKTIIKNSCGSEEAAIYSLAASIMMIASLLYQSINSAWAPWVQDCLHEKREADVKKASRKLIVLFFFIIGGVLLLGPELVLIMGGKQYQDSVYILPPLLITCMPQLVYSMFMNVEIYYKRTRIAAIGAMIVSVFNVGASILLVPRIGYQAAAYISLMSYLLLAMIHYIIVRKMNIREVYDIRFILVIVASEIGIMFLMPIVYQYTVIRYSVLAALIVGLVFFAKKNWETVKAMLKK